MERIEYKALEKADKEEGKRLFWIDGCSNVGKSFLVLEYVRKNYDNYFYIDYRSNTDFQKTVIDIASLAEYFSISEIDLFSVPVIIDNITDTKLLHSLLADAYKCPKVFFTNNSSIKYQELPSDNLISIIHLFPFTFKEFLWATGHEWYSDIIKGHLENRKKIPDMIHNELLDLFDIYFSTGGMPEIIEEYLKFENSACLGSRKKHLKDAVYASVLECEQPEIKIAGIISAANNIYLKKNRKFMYSEIRKGLSEKLYSECVDTLVNRNYFYKINRINDNSEEITKDFRLYFFDFGLYNNSGSNVLKNNLEAAPSSIIENYLAQCMAQLMKKTYYYESGKGAVVDFIIELNNKLVPIDIKLDQFKRSISAANYASKFSSPYILKIGTENCNFDIKSEKKGISIPIYALEEFILSQ